MEVKDSLLCSQQPCLSQMRNVQPDSKLTTQGTTLITVTEVTLPPKVLWNSPSYCVKINLKYMSINPYPTAFPYGNGMVLHFYQQQESSTTKTVHKVINKGLKTYV